MPNQIQPQVQPKKRNFAISYIKGLAILFIILIHLIDWGDMAVSPTGRLLKQILFTGVVFFMATSGSVVWIAYGKSDDLVRSTKRLVRRGAELIGIYYLYNILKFAFFDFSTENFYGGFMSQGIFNWKGILTLQSFAVPIPILFTIGFLIILSPIFLYILKKVRGGVWYLVALLTVVIGVNYFFPLPANTVTNFLYARGNITFSILPWFTAFLLGLLVAYAGFEQKKKIFLFLFTALVPLSLWYASAKGQSWYVDASLHPLQPQAIAMSFAFMFALMYVFDFFQKYIAYSTIRILLATLRVLGDSTLWLYIVHWIVIDSILLTLAPRSFLVWPAVGLMFVGFLWWKRRVIQEYSQQYV